MACPFFMPTQKMNGGPWPHPARLPLGAGWKGTCSASPGHVPSEDELRDCCNIGYASCAYLPEDRSADAVRFAITTDPDGSLVVKYACERNHRPADCGTLTFNPHQMKWVSQHGDPGIQRLAHCFVDAFLSRQR